MTKLIDAAEQDRRALGQALRALRQKLGITQSELAVDAVSDHTYISRLEHGRIDVGWSTLRRLLRALGADLHVLADAIAVAEQQGRDSRR